MVEPFAQPPVDGLEVVQRRLGLGDLHLGGGEALAAGPLGQPAGDERLAGAVLAADRLEHGAAGGDGRSSSSKARGEAVEADGEHVEPALRARCRAAGRR